VAYENSIGTRQSREKERGRERAIIGCDSERFLPRDAIEWTNGSRGSVMESTLSLGLTCVNGFL